jgi:PilZ domain
MIERALHAESVNGLRAVFVASADVLANWASHLPPASGVLMLSDADLPRALQMIAERRPPLVIIEQRLAASTRGAAMLACIKDNPAMAGIEVQVLSAERSAAATARTAIISAASLKGAHVDTVDRSLVRRAPRVRVAGGLRAVIDGNPAAIVDFSVLGAQVLSPTILRPNQRVRVMLLDEAAESLRATAGIAWSAFQRVGSAGQPVFRVGIEFNDVDPQVRLLFDRLRQAPPLAQAG